MACRRNFAVFNAALGKAVCLSGTEEPAVYDGCQQFLQGAPDNLPACGSCGCHQAFHLDPSPLEHPLGSATVASPVTDPLNQSSLLSSPKKRKLSCAAETTAFAPHPPAFTSSFTSSNFPISGKSPFASPTRNAGETIESHETESKAPNRDEKEVDFNSPRVLNFLKPFKPGEKHLQCPICFHCFLNNGNMNSHFTGQRLNGQHMTEGVIECYFCGRVDVGSSKDELFKHMVLTHMDNSQPYSCYKCRLFTAANKSRLSGHVKRCLGVDDSSGPFKLIISSQPSEGLTGLGADSAWTPVMRQTNRPPAKRRRKTTNVSEDDEDPYDLGISSEEEEEEEEDYGYTIGDDFASYEPIRKKIPVAMTRETFLSQFTPGGYLKRQIQCPTCLYCYTHEQGLEVHMIHHLQDSQLECYFCFQIFPVANSLDLLEHMVDDHLNQDNPFSCTLCDQLFASKAAQVRHFSRHRKD
eukprot:TRINITY_DN6139_c2_g1_i1.p1 TRINITY_DN6139_c2_g1~~TRINITY_DN6139_c2_g1_i1.p1  ORF type:complete len:467 (-),score=97.91 TRINITY_DN6139_c2_g1_i1:17-1417(-)